MSEECDLREKQIQKNRRLEKLEELSNRYFRETKDDRKRKQKFLNKITKKAKRNGLLPYNSVKPKKAVKTDEDVLKKTIEQFTNTQLINDYKPLNFNDMEYDEVETEILNSLKSGKIEKAKQLSDKFIKTELKRKRESVEKAVEYQKLLDETKIKKKPKLFWRFRTKERWEQKGNL